MRDKIYNALYSFLHSQSNIGHFERAKDWKNIEDKKLEEIFENQKCQKKVVRTVLMYNTLGG